ncbi:histidine phosphatase family protein [Pseudoflavitalea sp. G-6-1-2]|uniref:SixA phosphatase family protein n=1 Tax=Pseudoflavitalea sp. G-6-1-2 TaxID=2728841 RepID=UPI00146C6A24|nr:histidine phosphatase family protein [Pseudoflavitalea sp. G-6-1-2]NML20147.1 histidine phosphatase family protein [Pseudoflavitalea sp. G-6-1-2]
MKKSVIVVRHAKSSWSDISQPDFERPLNDRGKADAPAMAKRLLDKNIQIDAFITSPAKRAKKTATLFAEVYGIEKEQLIQVPSLYHAEPSDFFRTIAQAPESANTIAVFSHNPGITAFVNMLTKVNVDDMPTCAMYAVHCELNSWAEFESAQKEFWFFDYPKSIIG